MNTRAFARVIGPYITLVIGIIEVRIGSMQTTLASFFDNPIIAWMTGALLLFSGLLIIAFHQYWRTAPAIAISLFGWFLALRGFILMAAPELMARGVSGAMTSLLAVRLGFSLLLAVGLWLTYVGWRPARPA